MEYEQQYKTETTELSFFEVYVFAVCSFLVDFNDYFKLSRCARQDEIFAVWTIETSLSAVDYFIRFIGISYCGFSDFCIFY